MRTPPIIGITHYKALAQIMQANQAKSRREPYAQLPAGFSTIYRVIPPIILFRLFQLADQLVGTGCREA